MTTVRADSLATWTAAVLESWGYASADAGFIADSLVDANLRGVDSHGVLRLPAYARRVEEHLVVPTARPIVTRSGGAIAVDANGAPGQLAARDAVERLVTTSRELGVAFATVRGSTHFGAAGYYARLLAAEGQVAFVVSNSEPAVVPHGGSQALLGTNPLAFAAPTGGAPVSLDMATSTVAMGKVAVALAQHEKIPADWGVDEGGKGTTDPAAVTALLPMGGPKGYGLAMIVEILGGVLSGAAIAHDLGNMYTDFERPQNVGHWMLALNIEAVMPIPMFAERMQSLIAMVRATPATDAARPVLLPGEPEDIVSAVRSADGIPLPDDTVAELSALGDRYGVPFLSATR
ncbi:MAG: Ldh family oxidoreductase [Actinomycetota bacterium]|nr:Ldh family oxidoreductase [Actinomycetota bacterium]